MTSELEAKKVRWRCNRGMLELDLFLIPFADNHFRQLANDEKAQFITLLSHEDPTIYGWLMGQVEVDEDLKAIVLKVKSLVGKH